MKDARNILYVATSCRWFFALGCLLIGGGCGGESNGDTSPFADQREVELIDGKTAEVVKEGGRPVSLAMPDGRMISLTDAETLVDNQLVIQTPAGRVEVHRIPNHVVHEMDQLPHLYLKEGSLEEYTTQGFRGEPHVGKDGLYWSARVCKNPECAGASVPDDQRPSLFINRLPGVWLGDDGKLASANSVPGSLVNPCPACGSSNFVRQYILPETARRRVELEKELSDVRAARRAVERPQ